ncbi:MAG: hypothetical protein ACC742_11555 [Thermoanaerobaculales bacterium]
MRSVGGTFVLLPVILRVLRLLLVGAFGFITRDRVLGLVLRRRGRRWRDGGILGAEVLHRDN